MRTALASTAPSSAPLRRKTCAASSAACGTMGFCAPCARPEGTTSARRAARCATRMFSGTHSLAPTVLSTPRPPHTSASTRTRRIRTRTHHLSAMGQKRTCCRGGRLFCCHRWIVAVCCARHSMVASQFALCVLLSLQRRRGGGSTRRNRRRWHHDPPTRCAPLCSALQHGARSLAQAKNGRWQHPREHSLVSTRSASIA